MADRERVARQSSVEHCGRFSGEETITGFGKFVFKRSDIVARGEFRLFNRAVLMQNGNGYGVEAIGEDRRFFKVDFVRERKRTRLLLNTAARSGNDEIRIVVDEMRIEVLRNVAAKPAEGTNRFRHAEHSANEVGVVNMKIKHRTAGAVHAVKVLEPSRIGNNAGEVSAEALAEFARYLSLINVVERVKERQDMPDREQLPVLLGRFDHSDAFFRFEGDRLFQGADPYIV